MTVTVHDLSELMTPAQDDEILIWDVSAGQSMKIKRSVLIGALLTGVGTIATGGFTLTVPATGTAALLGTAQSFTQPQTFTDEVNVRSHTASNLWSLDVGNSGTVTVGSGFVFQLSADSTFSGLVIVVNNTNGGVGMFLMGGGGCIEMADTINVFSNAVGTANSTNVYWDGSSQYLLKNTTASGITYRIFSIRMRPSS